MRRYRECSTSRPAMRRGSAMSLMIIVAVVVTGLVMSIAWSTSVQTHAAGERTSGDQAFYAADGALQWALCEFKSSPAWPAANLPKTVIVNGWNCTVSYTDLGSTIGMASGVLGNPLKFSVKGSKTGSTVTVTTAAKTAGVLAYAPQFTVGGNLAVAQSATILGDVQTLGTLTINPPSSGGVITKGAKGNWKSKGGITDNNPSGTASYFSSTPAGNVSTLAAPSQTAAQMFATLKAGPTTPINNILTTNPATGNIMLDFSLAGGKPVYFAGNASYLGSVDFKSSANPANDTLLIDGPANFTGAFPANQSVANMHMLINGDVTFNGTGSRGVAINGSFYVTGNWTQAGIYTFTGTIISDKTSTLGGTGTVGIAAPPTFDPRYTPEITAYYGVLP